MTWLLIDVRLTSSVACSWRAKSAVIELVWNAIDAEAEHVKVVVAESPLGGVEESGGPAVVR